MHVNEVLYCFTGVAYASVKLGIFLCDNCANVHRSLGAHLSRPKALKNEKWEESEIQVDVVNVIEALFKCSSNKI
jgi:hypothetical protein